MTSVLDRITEEHIHSDPFPYLTTTEALEPSYYESLAAHYPDLPNIIRMRGSDKARQQLSKNNELIHMNEPNTEAFGISIDPLWRDFFRFHTSNDFFRQIIAHLGDGIRRSYPDLEQKLGKSLEELTVQPRYAEDQGADLKVEIQFAFNTPVRKASKVRSFHVDDSRKLFAGLFYMRAPEDDSIGGDLEICRWREEPQFRNPYVPGHQVENTHIQDHQVDLVNTVKYRANTLMIFVNSPFSIHGVTERQPTPHIRRYINIIAEFSEPLYDFQRYQENPKPWALMMGGAEKS